MNQVLTASNSRSVGRVRSVDILRGLVMVVMALDHCRDFFSVTSFNPEDLTATTPSWFTTRWVTHFCAPLFVFLAGTSAWLYRANRSISKSQLARFLVVRGIWLIIVEIVIIGILLHFGGYPFFFLQVIWVIGWSMILLAVLIYLPTWAIALIGILMIACHNLLDGLPINSRSDVPFYWQLLHVQAFANTSPIPTIVAYPLIPWPGVMALGYAFGRVLQFDEKLRDRVCLVAGGLCVILFFVLRASNLYGDPSNWAVQKEGAVFTVMSFLNTTKYPPSLLFLLMTIGPSIMSIPLLERLQGVLINVLDVFGRIPFFYYVIHWLVIRSVSFAWLWLQFGTTDNLIFTAPSTWPETYEPSLLRTYLTWIAVVAVLYPICRWYMKFKSKHKDWHILSYL